MIVDPDLAQFAEFDGPTFLPGRSTWCYKMSGLGRKLVLEIFARITLSEFTADSCIGIANYGETIIFVTAHE